MIQFLINPSDCNLFELDMISNAQIEGVLKPKSIEKTTNSQYLICYEEPIGKKTLEELLHDDFFDLHRYHDFMIKIISLKSRLETYMLNSNSLYFSVDSIWYDSVSSDYLFIYLPDTKVEPNQELNLYRHVFIESSQLFEKKSQLLSELRLSHFDLNHFCELMKKENPKKTNKWIWKKKTSVKDRSINILETKTIQRTRKSCLLDAIDPTVYYEIHFSHVLVGRSDECNIQINDPSISRRHAVISKNRYEFSMEDLNSSNGTYHNGLAIRGSVALVNGDKLQFGDKEFIFIL